MWAFLFLILVARERETNTHDENALHGECEGRLLHVIAVSKRPFPAVAAPVPSTRAESGTMEDVRL